MWIRSQDQEELLEVKRIKSILVEGNDVNILAKLEGETVILGTYHKEQADSIMDDLKESVGFKDALYIMPKRWEDEEGFQDLKAGLEKISGFMRDFAEAAAKIKTEEEEQK